MSEKQSTENMVKKFADSLTDEQKTALKRCRTSGKIIELLQTEGFELSDEMAEMIAGGTIPTGNFIEALVRYI